MLSVPGVPGTVPGTVASVCVRPYVVGRGTLTRTVSLTVVSPGTLKGRDEPRPGRTARSAIGFADPVSCPNRH